MSARVCWILIKGGCDSSQEDGLAALNSQQNSLWYLSQLEEYSVEISQTTQDQIHTLSEAIANNSNQMKNKAKQLETLLKNIPVES